MLSPTIVLILFPLSLAYGNQSSLSLDPIDFSEWSGENSTGRTGFPISPKIAEFIDRNKLIPQSPTSTLQPIIDRNSESSGFQDSDLKSQDLSTDYIASHCKCTNYCPPDGTRIRNERAINTASCRNNLFMCCIPPKSTACGLVPKFPSFHPYPTYGEADFGEYPWTALILDLNTRVLGIGILISPTSVLTTARNVMPYLGRRLKVRLGEWDLGSDVEPWSAVEYLVSEVRLHPDFNERTFQNDLTILRLSINGSSSGIPFHKYPHIRAPCIARPGDLYKFHNANCLSAGWALDSNGQSRIVSTAGRNLLKEVDLQLLSPSGCQAAIRRASKNPDYYWDEGAFLCAGGISGKGLCKGDEGAGLICQDRPDSPFVLTGISSWGTSCGEPGFPGVFTNIGTYYNWIKSIDPSVQYA